MIVRDVLTGVIATLIVIVLASVPIIVAPHHPHFPPSSIITIPLCDQANNSTPSRHPSSRTSSHQRHRTHSPYLPLTPPRVVSPPVVSSP